MSKKTLRDKALESCLHSRFVAREDDLRRHLTDKEVKEEARYLLDTIPYAGYDEDETREMMKDLRKIVRR